MFHAIFSCAWFVASLLIVQATGSPGESFKELGSLFLWGILGAAGLAVVVVLIWLKIQSKRENASAYVSIKPSSHENRG